LALVEAKTDQAWADNIKRKMQGKTNAMILTIMAFVHIP
jgi:hypothetical protein